MGQQGLLLLGIYMVVPVSDQILTSLNINIPKEPNRHEILALERLAYQIIRAGVPKLPCGNSHALPGELHAVHLAYALIPTHVIDRLLLTTSCFL